MADYGLSLLNVLFGSWLLLVHGGVRITAAGAFGYSTAIFVGLAGLFLLTEPQRILSDIEPVLSLSYFSALAVAGLADWDRTTWTRPVIRANPTTHRIVTLTGVALLPMSYMSDLDSLGYVGVVLIAAVAFASDAPVTSARLWAPPILAFAFFYQFLLAASAASTWVPWESASLSLRLPVCLGASSSGSCWWAWCRRWRCCRSCVSDYHGEPQPQSV